MENVVERVLGLWFVWVKVYGYFVWGFIKVFVEYFEVIIDFYFIMGYFWDYYLVGCLLFFVSVKLK